MPDIIITGSAPAAVGPYSQAVKAGNFLFISGQLPINPATKILVKSEITAQTHQSLDNVKAIVEAAGMGLANLVKVSVFLTDIKDLTAMNSVYETYFQGTFPARVTVEVTRLPADALIEIEAIAFKE